MLLHPNSVSPIHLTLTPLAPLHGSLFEQTPGDGPLFRGLNALVNSLSLFRVSIRGSTVMCIYDILFCFIGDTIAVNDRPTELQSEGNCYR